MPHRVLRIVGERRGVELVVAPATAHRVVGHRDVDTERVGRGRELGQEPAVGEGVVEDDRVAETVAAGTGAEVVEGHGTGGDRAVLVEDRPGGATAIDRLDDVVGAHIHARVRGHGTTVETGEVGHLDERSSHLVARPSCHRLGLDVEQRVPLGGGEGGFGHLTDPTPGVDDDRIAGLPRRHHRQVAEIHLGDVGYHRVADLQGTAVDHRLGGQRAGDQDDRQQRQEGGGERDPVVGTGTRRGRGSHRCTLQFR